MSGLRARGKLCDVLGACTELTAVYRAAEMLELRLMTTTDGELDKEMG